MLSARGRRPRDWRAPVAAIALALVLVAVLLRRSGLAGGWWHAPDRALLLALRHADDLARPIGPRWIDAAAAALTALGSWPVLLVTTVAAAGALLVAGRAGRAALLIAATIGGRIAVEALKHVVARTRPTLVPHLAEVASASFPSAHAANAAIVLLGIATIATQGAAWPLRRYAIAVAAALALVIGMTRVWLGVHWPSDVAAGWTFGLGWAMAWWRIAEKRVAR